MRCSPRPLPRGSRGSNLRPLIRRGQRARGRRRHGERLLTTYTTIVVEPVTAVIGAEVRGLDLRRPLDDTQRAEVRRALLRHHVLFFRDAELTEDQQLAFATQFAPPMLTGPGAMGAM